LKKSQIAFVPKIAKLVVVRRLMMSGQQLITTV